MDECTCKPGFSGDGFTCTDNDECSNGENNCDANATCNNTDGGFECACNAGFNGNGVSCTDINECKANPCDVNATCANTSGLDH